MSGSESDGPILEEVRPDEKLNVKNIGSQETLMKNIGNQETLMNILGSHQELSVSQKLQIVSQFAENERRLRKILEKHKLKKLTDVDSAAFIGLMDKNKAIVRPATVYKSTVSEVYLVFGPIFVDSKEQERNEELSQLLKSVQEEPQSIEESSDVPEDVSVLARSSGVSIKEAQEALEANDGDVINAAMYLRKKGT